MGPAGVGAIVGDTGVGVGAGVGEGSAADGVGTGETETGMGGESVAGVGEGWVRQAPALDYAVPSPAPSISASVALSAYRGPQSPGESGVRDMAELANPLDPSASVSSALAPPHAGLVGSEAGTKGNPFRPGRSPPPSRRKTPSSRQSLQAFGAAGVPGVVPPKQLGHLAVVSCRAL
ncbi:hypothetical protein GWK47_044901 [Chionoecetes opilio]|uniref:Uncharacterized protein n=1 Tax=Chionoecetes opilio TaxID=41210 RepID=A0A8J4YEI8_CHIOP|nr:hypothetical protein GWK47_044901 [Chionoecetes opilio]